MNQSLYNRTEMALIVTHVTGYLWIVTVSSLYFQSTDKPFPQKCTQALITLVLIWFPLVLMHQSVGSFNIPPFKN